MTDVKDTEVINAAGKLTALGGSAQSEAVARAQADIARKHVDLAALRALAGRRVAELTDADAACITSGAAAGIAISVAAVLTGTDLDRVQRLPQATGVSDVLLQAGHAVNFGAPVEQMIRLGGGNPRVIGNTNAVPEMLLTDILAKESFAAFLYVKSHHCVQENMIPLEHCIRHCHTHHVPVIVDAAAEEDLQRYIAAGADLVTYSGGKAFGGPTVGFIAGKESLIEACELQFRGIARTMKVGKEAIMGLLAALDEYVATNSEDHRRALAGTNDRILSGVSDCSSYSLSLKSDEAGRPFERVAVTAANGAFRPRELVDFLAKGSPAIRTRNHHLDQGIVLIDPRELHGDEVDIIIERLKDFDRQLTQ